MNNNTSEQSLTAAIAIMADLECALMMTREHNPDAYVGSFVDSSIQFKRLADFLHSQQHRSISSTPATTEPGDSLHDIAYEQGYRGAGMYAGQSSTPATTELRSPIGKDAKLNELILLAMLWACSEQGSGYDQAILKKSADHAAKLWFEHLSIVSTPATTDEVERLTRDERLDYERQILAAEVEWVGLARKALAFCELIEGNTKDLDCALILANNVAEARKYDRFHVEPWMPRLLALKDAILSNPLFPNHGERQS